MSTVGADQFFAYRPSWAHHRCEHPTTKNVVGAAVTGRGGSQSLGNQRSLWMVVSSKLVGDLVGCREVSTLVPKDDGANNRRVPLTPVTEARARVALHFR